MTNIDNRITMDDPITNQQLPSLRALGDKFALDGLRILAFPTDQGYYEPDVSEMVRLKAFQVCGRASRLAGGSLARGGV